MSNVFNVSDLFKFLTKGAVCTIMSVVQATNII